MFFLEVPMYRVHYSHKSGLHLKPGPRGGVFNDVRPPFGSHENLFSCPLLHNTNKTHSEKNFHKSVKKISVSL